MFFADMDRKNSRLIATLATRGVTTMDELIAVLPTHSPKIKDFGIWWLQMTKTRRAESVLLRMLHDDPPFRLSCAHTLAQIGGQRSTREFVRIGKAQLASPSPDRKWLEAVIRGLTYATTLEAEEVLLTIYERTDLPGWLRGDAGDALGCCSQLHDRRTRFFRRAWATALNGLDDADIEVQFWSMYVLMQLAQNYSSNPKRANARFAVAASPASDRKDRSPSRSRLLVADERGGRRRDRSHQNGKQSPERCRAPLARQQGARPDGSRLSKLSASTHG